jgi:hypothetical protein
MIGYGSHFYKGAQGFLVKRGGLKNEFYILMEG